MKIGICAPPEKLPLLAELGYDYFEANFSWLADLDEDTFRSKTALVEASPLRAEAFNGFFPGGMRLYSPDGDQSDLLREIAAYCEKGFSRASAWGGKVAVIGSGYVRGIPEGMSWEETDVQFARVLAVCGEAAAKYGMAVTVEPLSRNECSYIHTVAEGAKVARMADRPAVGMMVDFYHHWKNGEDLATLPDNADLLIHAHYARPGDRNAPVPGDEDTLRAIADVLRLCPGIRRISLEGIYKPDFDTAVRVARPLMEVFKEA